MAEGIDASRRMNCSRGWIPTGGLFQPPATLSRLEAGSLAGTFGNSSGPPLIGNRLGSILTRRRGP